MVYIPYYPRELYPPGYNNLYYFLHELSQNANYWRKSGNFLCCIPAQICGFCRCVCAHTLPPPQRHADRQLVTSRHQPDRQLKIKAPAMKTSAPAGEKNKTPVYERTPREPPRTRGLFFYTTFPRTCKAEERPPPKQRAFPRKKNKNERKEKRIKREGASGSRTPLAL